MATGKQGFVRASESQHLVSVQQEKEMHVQASLPAMYIQPVSSMPSYPQAQPAAMQDAAVISLSLPMMYANQAVPVLTLKVASGAGLQQQRVEPSASSSRPKSAGKHVCPHCGRDCLKPSVLEKHLRCHTGERPYPCSTCGISFKTQSNLYKHKRTQAHARLSSESGKGSFSSQESTESSRENCSSPSLELQNEDTVDTNRKDSVLPTVPMSTGSSEVKTGSETDWALCKAAVIGVIASPAHGQQVISHTQRGPQFSPDAVPIQAKSSNGDGRAPLIPNRTPLQRQEALFPKSQSHDSTDSGFSESSEQHLTASPGINEHNPTRELDIPETSEKLSNVGSDDIKGKVSLKEKQKLEEHILKLISKNSVVIDDKDLVNVRPRKTVLSKQGSIDLPMRYTYKDSFHFEMRSSKHQVCQKQDRNGRAFYSSMPTQHSTSLEHAPLTRSSSLPFSVGVPNSDSTVSPNPADNVPLSRRCSAGHIYPFKSVDQHAPSHRSLVRQVAVDGLSAAEGSPLDRGSLSSLSSDGDCTDMASEAVKRCRRKKAQKFAYNKWYMYGGGTFKKLYSIEKDSVLKSKKSTISPEQTDSRGIQISQQKDSNSSASISVSYTSCSDLTLSPVPNVLTAQTSSLQSSLVLVQNTPMKQSISKQTNISRSDLGTVMNAKKCTEEKGKAPEAQQLSTPIPSERKKQKTDEHLSARVENTEALRVQHCASRQINTNPCQSLPLQRTDVPLKSSLTSLQGDSGSSLNRQGSFTNLSSSTNHRQLLFKRHSSPLFAANMTGTSASPSVSSCISSVSEAKTSFLPKYQLKIPVLTDGMSDPCLAKVSSLNRSSPRQNVSLNQQPTPTKPSATQNQSAMATGREQNSLCITAITKAMTTTSTVHSCQDTNAYTSTSTKSVSLASPLTFTKQNVTVSTTHCSISPISSSSLSKNSHVYVGNLPSVQDNPVTPILISKPGVTPGPVLPSSTNDIPLGISSTEIQGSQDTFYMQTADLQIVMQLISDEQLALIEPHIETQNYKSTVNHCLLSKETSGAPTIQTGASQGIHKECSSITGTTLAAEYGNSNRGVLSNIPDITLMSLGSKVTEDKVNNTSSDTKGVISRSPSKSEQNVPPFLDSMALGQQCKLVNSTPENSTGPNDLGASGFASSSRSYLKQQPTKNLNKLSTDNSDAKIQTEVNKSSVHDQILRNYSTSIICGSQQNQDPTGRSRTIHTIVTSTNNAGASSEGKAVKVKPATFPEISKRNPNPPSANTSLISVASPMTPILSLNKDKPIQSKSCLSSVSSSGTARVSSLSRMLLACRGRSQKPLDKSEDKSNHDKHKSGQHLPWSETEEIKATSSRTAHVTSTQFESSGSVSNCLKEDNVKCSLDPGEMLHSQDPFKGPLVSCSLQSLKLQWEAGTARQPWMPLESKSGEGGDKAEWVGTWDTKSTWTQKEEESIENKKEEGKCTKSHHTAVKPHLDLSTFSMTNEPTASPEHVSISATSTICGITNPSHESKCLRNKDHVVSSTGANGPPQQTEQTPKIVKEHVSLGHHDSFPSSSKAPGDVRHLLAHPLLVNAIQKEVQKETHTKNSALRLTHSTSSQVQRPAPERETDERVQIGMLEDHCMTMPCTTEHCQIIKTTPMYTRQSCSNQTNSSCIHPNPTCISDIQSNPTENNATHGYMEEEEEEERSSSSDDEGKLVIELE